MQILYWALKGGGAGNFGVVTEFEIQCFEVPSDGIDYHVSFTNWDQAADVIMAYSKYIGFIEYRYNMVEIIYV